MKTARATHSYCETSRLHGVFHILLLALKSKNETNITAVSVGYTLSAARRCARRCCSIPPLSPKTMPNNVRSRINGNEISNTSILKKGLRIQHHRTTAYFSRPDINEINKTRDYIEERGTGHMHNEGYSSLCSCIDVTMDLALLLATPRLESSISAQTSEPDQPSLPFATTWYKICPHMTPHGCHVVHEHT